MMLYALLDTKENAFIRKGMDFTQSPTRKIYTREGRGAWSFDNLTLAAKTIHDLRMDTRWGDIFDNAQIVSFRENEVKYLREIFT
jgi:hypothetical protein